MIYDLKEDVDPKDLQMLHPALWILLTRTFLYCQEHKVECLITSLITDRGNVNSVSRTHEEGRAFDLRCRDWPQLVKLKLVHMLNTNYSDIAAVSSLTGRPTAAVLHDSGHGEHIHVQVRPNANWHRFIKE